MTVNYFTYVPKGKTKATDFQRYPLKREVSMQEARKMAYKLIMSGEVAKVKPNKYLPEQMAVYLQHTNKFGGLNPLGAVRMVYHPWVLYSAYDLKKDSEGPAYLLKENGKLSTKLE